MPQASCWLFKPAFSLFLFWCPSARSPRGEPSAGKSVLSAQAPRTLEGEMGRYALLWLLGVPIPILLLIYLFGGLH